MKCNYNEQYSVCRSFKFYPFTTLLDTGKEGETPKYIENLLKVISYLPEIHPVQVYNVYTYYIWDFSYVPLISSVLQIRNYVCDFIIAAVKKFHHFPSNISREL